MGRLYYSLLTMFIVFSTAMSFIALGIYASQWWWSVVGLGILVLFLALGGLLVPSAQKALDPGDRKTASAALQAFGASCAAEFFVMATVAWAIGNRSLYRNNAFQTLGLLIFLGLAGLGIQGALGALARFVYVRDRARIDEREAAST